MQFLFRQPSMPGPRDILPGRPDPIVEPGGHVVNGHRLAPPYPAGLEIAELAMGCFWGAEKEFWSIPGVWVTAVGYEGGRRPTPPTPRLHWEDRPRRGRPDRVRPGRRLVRGCSRSSGSRTIRPRASARATTSGRSTVPRSSAPASRRRPPGVPGPTRRAPATAGHGAITTRSPKRRPVLLRRGLPPGVPGQNPNGYCPNHSTGVKLPDDFVGTPLHYVD